MSHVSYHKLKFEEEHYDFANSKIQFILHRLDQDNSDIVVAHGEIEFNKILFSRDFFFTIKLDLFQLETKNISSSNNKSTSVGKSSSSTNNINKKPKPNSGTGRQPNNLGNKKNHKYNEEPMPINKISKDVSHLYKIAELEVTSQLFKGNAIKERDIPNLLERKNNENDNDIGNEDYNFNLEYDNKIQKQNYNPGSLNKMINSPLYNENENAFDEIKIDYDGILVLYLNIRDLKPIDTDGEENKFETKIFSKNFYISHKIFPGSEVSTSDIKFNSLKPNFNYQMLMPFTLNSRSIDLLETSFILIEIWHKEHRGEDELLGTVKLELNPILESLKIAEDTLSITPISKNLLPLVVYDGFYPVYNYEEFRNVLYLNLTLGFGTTTQVNNYIRKNNAVSNENLEKEKNNENSLEDKNKNKELNPQNINKNENINSNNNLNLKSSNKEDDFNFLNNLLNTKDNQIMNKNELHESDPNFNFHENKISEKEIKRNEEIDVEDILERNKKCYEDLNNKYKATSSSMNEKENSKKYEGNPFLVNNNNSNFNNYNDILKTNDSLEKEKEKREKDYNINLNINNSYKNTDDFRNKSNHFEKKPIFQVSRESNFYIQEDRDRLKSENMNVNLDKLTENDFFKSGGKMQKIDNMNLNNTIPDFKTLNINHDKDAYLNDDSKIENFEKNQNQYQNHNQNKEKEYNQKNSINHSIHHQNQQIKHSFEIYIDKLINLQILNKLPSKSFLKYKFLSGSDSESETWVKSDVLQYSTYDKQSSTIEVDLKSQHSILLSSLDKIKDHLVMDFIINFVYVLNDEEVIFARVCVPSEEIISILNGYSNTSSSELSSYYCIYGTEKIKRNECIIGKMKLNIKYEKLYNTISPADSSGNILLERQIIFNRKIPKNALLKFKLNYFKYDENFMNLGFYNPDISKGTSVFYLQIDPFGEDKQLKKLFPKQRSNKKYNSLNGIFEEEFCYNLLIESDILEYLKNRNSLINLIVYNKQHNFFNSSAESQSDSSIDLGSDNEYNDFNSHSRMQKSNFKEIAGSAKIRLSEIISNTDFSNRIYYIFTKDGVKLGCVNLEIKIENNLEIHDEQLPLQNNKNKRSQSSHLNKKKMKLENLKEIISQQNQKSNLHFDGKYFLIINLLNFVYDKNCGINKRLENKKFYLQYKFGKNIKKVSPIYEMTEWASNCLIDSPILNLYTLNFLEFLEMTISFSKNKPEDLIKALMENIFEIKLYLHEDNEHIGSFMIDLSKILLPKFKLTNHYHENNFNFNSTSHNIFHSGICSIHYYDIDSKKIEDFKLCLNLSFIKSDLSLSQFSNFFNNCSTVFNDKQNLDFLRYSKNFENEKTENIEKIEKNSEIEMKKNFKVLFEKISEKDNKVNYEYIDLHLFPLEDDNGELLIDNLVKFIFMFSNINLNSQIYEYIDIINNFFYNGSERKLNLKKNKGFIINKEKIASNNLFNIYNEEMKKLVDIFCQEVNNTQFGIYTQNNQEDNCIDIFDFLFHLYKFANINLESQSIYGSGNGYGYGFNPNSKYSNQRGILRSNSQPSSTLTIFIYSASNLTIENSSFSFKPNSYFTLQWGDDNFTSEVVIKSSHPSWNQKLEVLIGLNNLQNKFNQDILITFFNKLERDEVIGEVRINLMEIYRMKFFNEKREYEDYFNITYNERIRGQLNLQFILDEVLAQTLGKYENNINESYTGGSQFHSLRENTFNNNFNDKKSSIPESMKSNTYKSFKNDDVSHLDNESLWDKINKNTVRK